MKLKFLLVPALFLVIPFFCFAIENEQLTITTYYPSPYGSYNELRTYNNTYLATDGGNVGIGKANPAVKLDVSGDLLVSRNIGMNTTNITLTAPNTNTTGNLNANDIWLRSVNQWASQSVVTPNAYSPEQPSCIRMGNTQICWGRQVIISNVGIGYVQLAFPQRFKNSTAPIVTATYQGNSGAYVRCVDATDNTKTSIYYSSDFPSTYYINWIAIGVWQ